MIKLYRGDVIEVYYIDSKKGLKKRPVIVFQNPPKKSIDTISVYCTSQNDGDDDNVIFIESDSEEGRNMGLTKDTYIRPLIIRPIDSKFFVRKIGKCSLMQEIQKIVDRRMAS